MCCLNILDWPKVACVHFSISVTSILSLKQVLGELHERAEARVGLLVDNYSRPWPGAD